jgi:serine/threonine-protein kinase RsbW
MSGQDTVDLVVPADPAYLSVMRTATAGVATQLDLTVDEVEDLRIAVDEAGALLLGGVQHPTHELSTTFTVDPHRMSVRIDGPPASLPEENSFAWTVLNALTGEVTTGHGDDGSWIRLTRRLDGVTR